MLIPVKLFARARDLAGANVLSLELSEGSSVGTARAALVARIPALAPLAPVLLLAVNGEYAPESAVLESGCELACFPPVSGG